MKLTLITLLFLLSSSILKADNNQDFNVSVVDTQNLEYCLGAEYMGVPSNQMNNVGTLNISYDLDETTGVLSNQTFSYSGDMLFNSQSITTSSNGYDWLLTGVAGWVDVNGGSFGQSITSYYFDIGIPDYSYVGSNWVVTQIVPVSSNVLDPPVSAPEPSGLVLSSMGLMSLLSFSFRKPKH